MRLLLSILIITALPITVLAHGGQDEEFVESLDVRAGVLPGEFYYFIDSAGEWLEVNLLTPSTKQKQLKRVEFASERIAELFRLAEIDVSKEPAYKKAAARYEKELNRAEEMAEKILILDGVELPLAENFEQVTRHHEQQLHSLLDFVRPELRVDIMQAVSASRIENQKMFNYMVKNYQFTDEDIEKHREIVREHLKFLESELEREDLEFSEQQQELIDENLAEAEKFLEAGLNIQAYEYVNKVKDTFYSQLVIAEE